MLDCVVGFISVSLFLGLYWKAGKSTHTVQVGRVQLGPGWGPLFVMAREISTVACWIGKWTALGTFVRRLTSARVK